MDKDIIERLFDGRFDQHARYFHVGESREGVFLSSQSEKWTSNCRQTILSDLLEVQDPPQDDASEALSRWVQSGASAVPSAEIQKKLKPTKKFDSVFEGSLMKTTMKTREEVQKAINDHYKV